MHPEQAIDRDNETEGVPDGVMPFVGFGGKLLPGEVKPIQEIEADWFEAALKVKVKKFGAGRETDFKYAMKQKQFLQYRGFYSEHIEFAVKGE